MSGYWETRPCVLVTDRPQHDGMIDLCYLHPGIRIELRNSELGSFGVHEVLECPRWTDFCGLPTMRVVLRRLNASIERIAVNDHFLSDMGLMPYFPGGKWNRTNYVVLAK